MSEFRSGNKGRSHPYPVTPRASASAAAAFARNFAKGPGGDIAQAVTTTGVQVNWGTIDVPADPPTLQDIPITPQTSGVIVIRGVIAVQNNSVNQTEVTVQVQVNDVTIDTPAPVTSTGEGGEGGFESIPFLVQVSGLPIGTTIPIQVLVTASADDEIVLPVNDSTVEVLEVPVSTG